MNIFGPVISRRLGRSLGVDVVPFKVCTYDCVYCQLGPTTSKSVERGEFVPLETLVAELRQRLDEGLEADYITLAGSGEPTLYSRLGELIAAIKTMTSIPVAIITNGSLFWRPEVRAEVCGADLLVPSLDVTTAEEFEALNRPAAGIAFEEMMEGLVQLRAEFSGTMWLEVFLLAPLEVDGPQVRRLKTLVDRIAPDRVQLNSVARPAPGSPVQPAPLAALEAVARLLGPHAEVVAAQPDVAGAAPTHANAGPDDLYAIIRRHPSTVDDLVQGLGIKPHEARQHIQTLLDEGRIAPMENEGQTFYIAV